MADVLPLNDTRVHNVALDAAPRVVLLDERIQRGGNLFEFRGGVFPFHILFETAQFPRRSPSWRKVDSAALRILDYPEEHLSEMDDCWIVTMTIQTSFS